MALGLTLKLRLFTSRLSAVVTSGLQAWHKFTATTWSGSNRLPDSSPVATNTAALYTGRALDFDGVNDVVTVGATGATVKTVIFYANPDTTTQSFMQLQSSGAVRIQIASGTLSATGFTSPTLYVNGAASSSVSASSWQMIAVTSATGVSASNLLLGQQNTTFYSGIMADVKLFTTELSAGQIAELYANPEQALPTGSVDADLVGWYPLDENGPNTVALDCSLNNKIGTISGATYTTGIGGAVPQPALAGLSRPLFFDGTNDYVTATIAAGGTAFSMAGHFMATLTNNFRIIFGVGNTTGGSCMYLRLDNSSLIFANNFTSTLNTSTPIVLGKMYHAVLTASGTSVKIYVDGALAASGTFANTLNITNLTCSVGNHVFGTGSTFWAGIVRTAAFWNVELTAGEAASLYAGTAPTSVQAANLQNYFINTGPTAADWVKRGGAGGSGNGTVNGSPTSIFLRSGISNNVDITRYPIATQNTGQLILAGDSYASMADAATLDITTAITLEAWVKPYAVTAAQTIVGKNSAYALNITSGAKLQFSKWTSASNATAASSASIVTTAWTHVAVTYSTGACTLYINGVADTTTASLTGSLDATSTAVLIGALTTSTNLFTGLIDSVKIYNAALTAAQVAGNYAAEVSNYQ